ncbi:MAG: chemotaxis response regulator protein-glutamate methylesterase [Methanoregula sp.]|nr:chemotaxis response regulator protein-glutamate methylesterase [Methanoregula sp.]
MIRVLIVDDSSFMRKSLTHILESDPAIEVAATAENGELAVTITKEIKPDVILLDIEMPVMDGLTALTHIMTECPTPVVMISALNKRDATLAIRSLEYGAVDFIPKPSGEISYDIETVAQEIRNKVRAAVASTVVQLPLTIPDTSSIHPKRKNREKKEIVVIGASTGGPKAIIKILSDFPDRISPAVLIVQHMDQPFLLTFVERLQSKTPISVTLALDGEIIQPGHCYVAPGGCNTIIVQAGLDRMIALQPKTTESALTPSIDRAMTSAAAEYNGKALGVLLTGMGSDGASGMNAIKDAGGSTLAEDPSTCVISGMPKAAIDLGCVDAIVPLPAIAFTILGMVG